MELQWNDIQGLIMSSYSHLPCAAYVLLSVTEAAPAKAWLGRRISEITTSTDKDRHRLININLAFTFSGLKNLGLNQKVLPTFSFPFHDGMATEHRRRILGDRDENDPERWDWGGTEKTAVDILLMIFAKDEATLDSEVRRQQQDAAEGNGLELRRFLSAGRQPGTHEHFGFNDGIGQPTIQGTRNSERQKKRTNHVTPLPAGEFLLGHANAYGVTADSPVVEPAFDPRSLLPDVPSDASGLNSRPGMRDLGRNGTYLVFRQLEQHVGNFWQFLDQATRRSDGTSDPSAREKLGAKFVGRWRSGAPLVLAPAQDNPKLSQENNFSYYKHDPAGFACPIGAHIRRANPRDSMGPDAETALQSANRHRILRRGRSYGESLKDLLDDDGKQRGLHFICLNSDIERQFEFVQQTWVNNPVFGGLYNEVDPLIGNLAKGDEIFTVQAQVLRTRVHNLSRFVTVKGGAYFFLPSIRALTYLASL
jgi:Dyp-type peroxidase family